MVYIAEVKVYVWLGRESLDLDLGHASMGITGADGSYIYISFYPGTNRKKGIEHVFKSSSGSMIEKHDEDCYKMERKPDKIICIRNLPNPKNLSIDFYKNYWQKHSWKLLDTNCCHVVINNLCWMSGIPVPQSWHFAWSPSVVIKYGDLLCSKAFPKPLIIEGTVGYTISASTVEIRADKLLNNRNDGTSETLKLKFWATKSPDDIANINDNGHIFAETQFDPLKKREYYYDIKRTVTYHKPPGGTYYVVATLHEYENGEWPIYDWVSFNNHQFTSKALIIEGTLGYTINGSMVKIKADKLLNNRKGITSGTLKLKLWATTSPSDIVNINDNGHVFAETRFDELEGGKNYSNIKRTVTYYRPPAGTYYVVATLHEYENGEWPIYDWVSVNDRLTV